MDPALSILKALKSFPSEVDVLGVQEKYDHERWRVAFVGLGATQHQNHDVAFLLETYPELLSRDEILEIEGSDPADQNRRILIASLMWGYGTTGLRYPQRLVDVGTLLEDPGLDERLGRCRDCLSKHEVAGAYKELTGLSGIGSAFFTKFLYFLGRSLDPTSEYPLILDTMVAESLAWLTGFRELVVMADGYRPGSDPDSYAAYVTTMHGWARSLGTSADVIEFYLWHPPDDFYDACNDRAPG